MKIKIVLLIAILNATASLAPAALIVGFGNANYVQLLPNAAGQTFDISISGTGIDQIAGITLRAQVADGFPDAPASIVNGPNITAISLIGAGTLFSGNNQGQFNNAAFEQAWESETITNTGTIAPNGVNLLLARITIDTTGINSGEFPFLLMASALGDTFFLNAAGAPLTSVQIGNGTLAVPEPTTAWLAVLGFAFVGLYYFRNKNVHARA